MKPSVFFYVQHLLGVGHQMRASQLAKAMGVAGLDVHYISGGFNDMSLDLGGATLHQLPPIRSADAGFSDLIGENGKIVDSVYWQNRLNQMQKIIEEIKPAAYLIEGFPFARRKFSKEIIPILKCAKAPVFCSVRDILVPPSNDKKAILAVDQIQAYFTSVFVHGDERFIAFGESLPTAEKISDKLTYTGYVAPNHISYKAQNSGEIIVSAGGGAVGERLLTTAMALAQLTPNQDWRFLIGPNLPAACAEELQKNKSCNIIIEAARSDFRELLTKSKLSISQAGYNTVMDLMVTKTPSVLVPFGSGKESEQPARARLLAQHRLAICLTEQQLNPKSLNIAIREALDLPPIDNLPFKLQGAETTAKLMKFAIEGGAF